MKVLLALTMLFACSVFTAHGKHPRTFTPGLEGSTVGNLTAHGCYSGVGTSRASVDRCCMLRACCYAKLAARRCRLGPVQPLTAPQTGIPTCRLALASCSLRRFADMIKTKTGKSALAYAAYGCYCGSGGSKQPLDDTDWCCHAHNCCYKKLVSTGCKPKKAKYQYGFQGSEIICGVGNSCEIGTCLCDKKAAECFQRSLSSYRKSYSIYPNFLCKGQTPSC